MQWLYLCRIQTNWVGTETRGKQRKRKKRQLVIDSLPKKRSEALPQMRHSCKSDSETLAETLPSFLGWRKHRSLTFFLLSLRLLSPQALQNPGIKKKLPPNPPFLHPWLTRSKQKCDAFFLEAGVEAYAEHQI